MKRLILIKQSSAIQIAHLYEHIFCMYVDAFFRDKHLFPHVDYSLDGKTYHGGIVVIDIHLYTARALAVADKTVDIDIEVNERIVKTALAQLVAEIEEPFESTGYQAIADHLQALHASSWQSIDEITSIDVKHIRRTAGPLYVVEGRALHSRKLMTTLAVDKQFAVAHRELLPLFRQLAWLIISSWQHTVANEYGFFSFEDHYKDTKNGTRVTNIFNVPATNDVTAKAVLAFCRGAIEDLRRHGAFERYVDELQDVSYYDRPDSAPNYENNYEDTLLFLGSRGWRELATHENCDTVLKNMIIEVSFKQEKLVEGVTKGREG